jgi:chromosomal replication initiator protein
MAVWRVEQTSAVDLSARVIKELMQREATDALQVGDEFDMLIVDDLQWLLGKPGSQRYVAMLFRRMAASGASVICASGVAPRRLPELASVLRGESRYESVRIRMPEREVRRVIRHLADTRGVPLSAATVNLLAQRCRGDLGQAAGVVAQFEAAVRWPTSDAAAVAVDRLMRPSV